MRGAVKGAMQERFRAALKERMGRCRECGRGGSLRQLSSEIGLDVATLWRFLAGKAARGSTLDKIDAYLGVQARPAVPCEEKRG